MVVMKVAIHCQGCAGKVRKHISKMEGTGHVLYFYPTNASASTRQTRFISLPFPREYIRMHISQCDDTGLLAPAWLYGQNAL
jgi:hypothetical protein